MTDRWSRGYCVRMSVSSATATFLAARKQPRSSIERLMSTSRTVEVWVSCSVRWTSKSVGGELDPPIAARGTGRRRVLLAAQGVEQRPAQVEMERVAELVRLGRLVALPSPPAAIDPVAAERVPLEPREQVVEDLLADLAAAARGELQPLAVTREVAGFLEATREVVERIELARGVVAEQVAHLGAIDARRGRPAIRRRTARRPAGPSPGAGRSAPVRRRGRAARRHRTAPGRRARPAAAGRGSRPAGPGHQEPVVAQEGVHHRLELGALLRAHRAHQRLHRGHPLGELVDDVVEGAGAREELAVLGEELRRVGVATADPLADQLVEVADHLAVRGEVLRAHRADRLGHPFDELVEHLALEPLDELVEAVARVGLEEVVVLEAADPLADVGRQRVELIEPSRRDVAEHRPQGRRRTGCRVVGLSVGRASSRLRRVRRSTPVPSSATISSSSRRMSPSTSLSW